MWTATASIATTASPYGWWRLFDELARLLVSHELRPRPAVDPRLAEHTAHACGRTS